MGIVAMTNLFSLLMFLFLSTGAFAQVSKISVVKNHFVTSEGKIIILKGLASSDPLKLEQDGQWNRHYFEMVKSWGANCIRIPIRPGYWRSYGKEKYLKLLDQGVSLAEEVGLYVILDWHSIGNLIQKTFFQDAVHPDSPMEYATTREETFDFWRAMAVHYKGNNTVAFFELFNEPTFLVDDDSKNCFWLDWKTFLEELIVDIRASGGTAVPLVSGFNYGYDLTSVMSNPINAEGIGYVAHPYPEKVGMPWKTEWTHDWGFVADRYPLFLTEIGFATHDEPGSICPFIGDTRYGDAILSYCDHHGISYTVWCFDPDWKPSLIKDWTYTPTKSGAYFKKALQTEDSQGFLWKIF